MNRICKYCNQEKPIEEFYRNKHCKDGYLWSCKLCSLKYYDDHPRKKYPYKSVWDSSKHHGRPYGSKNKTHKTKGDKLAIETKLLVGVYKLQSRKFPDRIYIGSSTNMNLRVRFHKQMDGLRDRNYKLYIHIKEYGFDDFIFTILKICEPSHIIYWEQYFISELEPFFNIRRFATEPNSRSNEARLMAKKDMQGVDYFFSYEYQIYLSNTDFKEEIIPFNIL